MTCESWNENVDRRARKMMNLVQSITCHSYYCCFPLLWKNILEWLPITIQLNQCIQDLFLCNGLCLRLGLKIQRLYLSSSYFGFKKCYLKLRKWGEYWRSLANNKWRKMITNSVVIGWARGSDDYKYTKSVMSIFRCLRLFFLYFSRWIQRPVKRRSQRRNGG